MSVPSTAIQPIRGFYRGLTGGMVPRIKGIYLATAQPFFWWGDRHPASAPQLADQLTWLRGILAPPLAVFIAASFHTGQHGLTAVGLVLAGMLAWTDAIDGHIARRYRPTDTAAFAHGSFIDGLTDKVLGWSLVIALLVCWGSHLHWWVWAAFAIRASFDILLGVAAVVGKRRLSHGDASIEMEHNESGKVKFHCDLLALAGGFVLLLATGSYHASTVFFCAVLLGLSTPFAASSLYGHLKQAGVLG